MSEDVLTFVINAPDYDTFRTKLAKIAFDFGVLSSDRDVEVTAQQQQVPRRRGRPPRSSETVMVPEPVVEQLSLIEEPIAESSKELSMDDAKDAGRMVLAKKGVDVLKDVLKKFSVTKVADLKQPQFDEFIRACADIEGR